MTDLKTSIDKQIMRVAIGMIHEFESIDDALARLDTLDLMALAGAFEKFEVIIDYNNRDNIRASFKDKSAISNFLKKLEI